MAGSWIRTEKRIRIYHRDGLACAYCGRETHPTRDTTDGLGTTLDHLHPRDLGGSNDETNLVVACKSCNSSRQETALTVWLAGIEQATGRTAKAIRAEIRRRTARRLPALTIQAVQAYRDHLG